jgi:hypothetical protein
LMAPHGERIPMGTLPTPWVHGLPSHDQLR